MNLLEPDNNNRRFVLITSLWIGIGAAITQFFKTYKQNLEAGSSAPVSVSSEKDMRLQFLEKSHDLKNYLVQVETSRASYFQAMLAKHPELSEKLHSQFDDRFWKKYSDTVLNGFYQDTSLHLTEEDAAKAVEFFNTPAGQNYLKWKDVVQSRNSNLFAAVKKMTDELSFYTKKIVEENKKDDTRLT